MEPPSLPLFYLITAAVFNCIYISLLSSTKIVLGQVENYKNKVVDNRILHIIKNVEEILENRMKFAMVVSFAKSVAVALLGILFYLIAEAIFPQPQYLWKRLLGCTITTAIIAGFMCYSIPRAFAIKYASPLLAPIYIFYNINRIILTVSLVVPAMYLVLNSLLKAMNYEEKYSFLTSKELNKLNEPSDSETCLEKEGKDMINNIFEFSETCAKEIMVPRIDVVAISIKATLKETLDQMSEKGHSRIPVYEDTIDSVVGILNVKDLVKWVSKAETLSNENWSLRQVIREPYYIPASKSLTNLMEDMKKKRCHIAIVVDEYGGTAGIVTMEDIIEEIVGDIEDEHDEEASSVQKIDERTFLVDPHIELDDLEQKIHTRFDYDDGKDYNTLGGLFYHEHGSVPKQGTELVFKGISLIISKMDAQRIEEIKIVLPENGDNSEIDNHLKADK
ncbi:MAG: hemolysin family protein [Chitinivibrionia bacterium]|nr:hemolysin family protein [Chitinivibrionia bacterium]